jgi:hypothetical protein
MADSATNIGCTEDNEYCNDRKKCVARVRRGLFMEGNSELPNPLAVQQCLDNDGDFDVKEWSTFKKSNPTQMDIVGGKRRKKSRKLRKRKTKSHKKARRKSLKRKKTYKKKH